MSTPKAAFVLVHGGWHNRSAWDKVTPILEAQGHAALTLDLPGAGANTIAPKSLGVRPFDLAAFGAEPSPVAGVTQEERTQAVVALAKEAASLGDGKVILVGHSAGGMTISAVAEQVPELLAAVVYLAGFMVPNGLSLLAMLPHESMASALSQDCAVPLAGQDHMIAAVDGTIGGTTITHTLESSHSPFLSQPAALSKILLDISLQPPADQSGSAVGLDT
jgi:pimeloyl-ACP methyl ester carboxylesterase